MGPGHESAKCDPDSDFDFDPDRSFNFDPDGLSILRPALVVVSFILDMEEL